MAKAYDLIGMQFGKLKVIERSGTSSHGGIRWQCVCECNRTVDVRSDHLLSGNKIDCGQCRRPPGKEPVRKVATKYTGEKPCREL